MPLIHRNEQEATDLKGVNLAADETKIPFGSFIRLENWVPGQLRAIKKKRGVAALDGISLPNANLQFQDDFIRGDCSSGVLVFVGACVECLTIDEATNTVIARSATATVPCFCFYGIQLCTGLERSVSMTFKETIAGSPISGLFIAGNPASTETSFSGYGLLYDPAHATQKLKLVKWSAVSLADVANATVLATSNTVLNANDILSLSYDGTTLLGLVNDASVDLSVTDTTFAAATNQLAGLVVVGTTGADDRLRWTNLLVTCTFPDVGACSVPAFAFTDFVFGLNGAPEDMPVGGTPALWVSPAGSVTVGSCTPDFFVVTAASDIQATNCAGPQGLCTNSDLETLFTCVTGLVDDPEVPFFAVLNQTITAKYAAESNLAINGVVMLTADTVSTTNMTGYGILINRPAGTAELVQWVNDDIDNPTVLLSEAYVPVAGDSLSLGVGVTNDPGIQPELNFQISSDIELKWPLVGSSSLAITNEEGFVLKQVGLATLTTNTDSTIDYTDVNTSILQAGFVCG